jgi:cell division protease FtsH
MLFPGDRTEMSDATAGVVDEEVTRLVNEAHDQARSILEQRGDLMARLSKLLMAQEVIEGEALLEYVEGRRRIPDPAEAPDRAATQELQPSGPAIIPAPGE